MKVKIRGKRNLQGSVEISGSKNSTVAIIPAAILTDDEVTIRNVPDINDVHSLILILQEIGYCTNYYKNTLSIRQSSILNHDIRAPEVKRLRGSYYFMGALLGKARKVRIYSAGGCNLGNRPINYHLDGFSKLGADILENDEVVHIKAKKLIGNQIDLEFPSVGATINIMLAAVKAKGVTTITNAANEPEVMEVGNFLLSMGADIKGLGSSSIIINGVKSLKGTDYTIGPDRIEAGTYIILGTLAKGKGITVKNVEPEKILSLLEVLKAIGCNLEISKNEIKVYPADNLKNLNLVTKPYPGFPTDLGQLITVLMLIIEGESTLTETIFSNRFSHVGELRKMGADIKVSDNTLYVNGPCILKPADLVAHDLRCAASLILASTLSKGITTIENIEVLLRGYENPLQKLRNIGLNISLS